MTADPPGDRVEFTALLKEHDARLRGLAFRVLGDRQYMDDALQDAYLRAYRARHNLRSPDEAGTWLYRIVYNACIDELRRSRRRPHPVDVAAAGRAEPVARDTVGAVADADVLRRALASLPDEQRVTVVLVDGEGFDHDEAAHILGVATGTVASRLSRGRAALRKAIGDDR